MTGLVVGALLALAAVVYLAMPLLRPMRASEALPPDAASGGAGHRDAAEALIRRYRRGEPAAAAPVCPRCGPRPEPDALFCSECGARLAGD